MKTGLITLALSFFSMAAIAQSGSNDKVEFSVGAELGVATGKFSNTHSVGVGATAQLEVAIDTKTDFTLTSGVLSYTGKSVGSNTKFKAATVIPVRAGIKYFFTSGLYGAGQLGIGFFNNTYKGNLFAYTPMIGYEFETKAGQSIDASFKYDGYARQNGGLGSVGIRVAYKF